MRRRRFRTDKYYRRLIRQRALKHAGWRCARCQAREQLEVHHKRRLSEGGTDEAANLEVLCKSCHIEQTADENIERARLAGRNVVSDRQTYGKMFRQVRRNKLGS